MVAHFGREYGFRPQIAEWVLETKKTFGWGPIQLTSDRSSRPDPNFNSARPHHFDPVP